MQFNDKKLTKTHANAGIYYYCSILRGVLYGKFSNIVRDKIKNRIRKLNYNNMILNKA